MQTALERIISNSGLDKSKSDYLLEKFADYTAIAESWAAKAKEIVVTDESQVELMKQASEGRKLLKTKRVEIEKTRKSLKEASLKEGRAIDDIAKALTALIEPTEQYLQLQEDFKKIKEQKRILDLHGVRMHMIAPYLNAFEEVGNLGTMPENQFNALLGGYKIAYQSKVDAEKKAEEDRIAKEEQDKKDREAQRIENEKLKAEKEAKEKADKERDELQSKRLNEMLPYNKYGVEVDMVTLWTLSDNEYNRIFQKMVEAKKLKDKQDEDARIEFDKEQQRIKSEKEKLEKELKEKREKEQKEIEEAEKLASAGDKEKLIDVVFRLDEFEFPEVKSKRAKVLVEGIKAELSSMVVGLRISLKSMK